MADHGGLVIKVNRCNNLSLRGYFALPLAELSGEVAEAKSNDLTIT